MCCEGFRCIETVGKADRRIRSTLAGLASRTAPGSFLFTTQYNTYNIVQQSEPQSMLFFYDVEGEEIESREVQNSRDGRP